MLLLIFKVHANVVIGKLLSNNDSIVKINDKIITNPINIHWGDKVENTNKDYAELLIYPSLYLKIKSNSIVTFNATKIEKNDGYLNAKNIIKVVKGGVVAEQYKLNDTNINTKIITKRSISSVRGTILEVNVDNEESIHLYEGNIDVLDLKTQKKINIPENVTLNSKFEQKKNVIDTPFFPKKEEVESIWKKVANEVMEQHKKNAKELQALFQKESESISMEISKEAKKMYKNIGNIYDVN